MKTYNYIEAMRDDVRDYIECEINLEKLGWKH